MQRLEPDPATAPYARWMFAQRGEGKSISGIARALNDQRVPCPSGVDRDRNPHRVGQAWTVPTVASILANPRYTGRQVWNRQQARRATSDEDSQLHLWSAPQEWVISTRATHPALVSEADFVAVQAIRSARPAGDGTTRRYRFAGLLWCGICHRRMDAHWANRRPGYRCRHGHTSSRQRTPDRPKSVYVREDHLLAELASELTNSVLACDGQPEETARLLREHDLIIVYNKSGSVVTSDRA
ncbi:recombinase family protein [Saccharopolyspora shandongensis]|uniref:recombinase family protein n=1 Tax=Saccharopolyspora shandongensis TaxID=418495 RepID=UPI0033CEC081